MKNLKVKKRLRGKLCVCLCMLMLIVSAVPAFAANTSDTAFTDFKATVAGYKKFNKGRSKTDDSAVYLKITSSDYYNSFRVRAYGGTSAGASTWVGATYVEGKGTVSYVTCKVGTSYEVHNRINACGYTYANLGFHSTGGSADYITGVWSPDCAGDYTDAT